MSDWERRKDDPKASWNRPKKKSPAKKDTRHWCKGKVGVEHQTEIVINSVYEHWLPKYPNGICGYRSSGKWIRYTTYNEWKHVKNIWRCFHIEQCTKCGKKLRCLNAEECPARRGPVTIEKE